MPFPSQTTLAISKSQEPNNPGKPLDDEDFLCYPVAKNKPNATTEEMMKIIADGEIEGSEHGMENPPMSNKTGRSGLEPIIHHTGQVVLFRMSLMQVLHRVNELL